MNLSDLHKNRFGIIDKNWKSLKIIYEFESSPVAKNNKHVEKIDIQTSIQGIKCHILGSLDGKILNLEIKLRDENKSILYQLALCFTYIVGKNMSLIYYVDNFPYYPIKKDFNFNRQAWLHQKRLLIKDPTKILRSTMKLLLNENTFFKKIVPLLEEINVLSYLQIIFLIEFSLLEKLSNEGLSQRGVIFIKDSEEWDDLKSFLDKSNELLEQYPKININAIKNKLLINSINSKSTTKDKINNFIDSFQNEIILEYKQYVNSWNDIRGKLAHGSFSDRKLRENLVIMKKVHNLLVDIVDLEFRNKQVSKKG